MQTMQHGTRRAELRATQMQSMSRLLTCTMPRLCSGRAVSKAARYWVNEVGKDSCCCSFLYNTVRRICDDAGYGGNKVDVPAWKR